MANAEKYYLYKSLREAADGYLKGGNLLVPTEETKDAEKKEYEINPAMLQKYEKVSKEVAEVDNKNVSGIVEIQLGKAENISAYRGVVDRLIEENEQDAREEADLASEAEREMASPVTKEVEDPFTSKFTKQTRMYMLNAYFGNKSSEEIKNMPDEEFLTCYVSMQNHVKRVSTCNDILHSALLKDPNYPQYIQDQELMEGRSRHEQREVEKAIVKSRKEFQKEVKKEPKSKKGSLRDFFTTNKMLRIIEGFDPIPAKYKEKAIASLLKAFEEVQKENVKEEENIKESNAGGRNNIVNTPTDTYQKSGPSGGKVPVNNGREKSGTVETNTDENTGKNTNKKVESEKTDTATNTAEVKAEAVKKTPNNDDKKKRDPIEELKGEIRTKEKVLMRDYHTAIMGDGNFTNRCILSCDANGNNIKYVDYFEIPGRPGRFIVSEEKTVENGRKTKGFKMSKKAIANVQNSMREGVIKFKSNATDLKEVEFVMNGKDSTGRQLYQSYESFKKTSPYISSVIFEDEFGKFNNNEVEKSAEIVSKVDIMRKFVDYGDKPTRQQVNHMTIVNDYLDFAINPSNPKFNVMRADVMKHEKDFKSYKKTHQKVSESLSEFSFAEQNKIRFRIERIGEDCKRTQIPRMHGCEDYDFKDGDKVLEYCGMKFNLSGVTAIGVDKNNKPIVKRYYETPAYPGFILLGKADVDVPAFNTFNQATETKVKSGCFTVHSANLGREVEFVNVTVVDSNTDKEVETIVSMDRLRKWPYDNRNYVLSQIYADKFKEFVNEKYQKSTKQTFLDISFNDFLDEFANTVVPFKDDINARKETIAEISGKENMEKVFDHERVKELDRVYDIYERMNAGTKESKKIAKDINKIVNSSKNNLDYKKYVNERGFSDKQLAMLSFVIENGLEPESFIDKNKEKEALKNANKVGKELERASSLKQIYHRSDVVSELQKEIEPKVFNLSEKESEQIMTPKFSVSDLERSRSSINMEYEGNPFDLGGDSSAILEDAFTLDENDPSITSFTNEDYLNEVERMEKAKQSYNAMAFAGGMDENADNEAIEQQKAEYEQSLESRAPQEFSSTSTIDGMTATANSSYMAEDQDTKVYQADYNVEVEDKENTAIDDIAKAAEEIQSQHLNANYAFGDQFSKDIAEKINEEIEKDRYTDVEEIQFDEDYLNKLRAKAQAVAEEEAVKDVEVEQNDGEAAVEEEPVVAEEVPVEEKTAAEEPKAMEEPTAVEEEPAVTEEEPVATDSDVKVGDTIESQSTWTSSLNKNNDLWLKDIENIEMMEESQFSDSMQYDASNMWQGRSPLEKDEELEHQNVEPQAESPMQMPSGINDMAVDVLWKDIYKTLSVKDENGKDVYNIGSTTMDILKCASGEPVEMDQKRAIRIKEILTKTYENHTLRSLIDNKGISEELQSELEKFGVDMEKCKFKGELNNELLSRALAETKYQKISELVSSDAGLSRIALFELSQAKYNPNGGKDDNGKLVEDHRRDSWFYKALCKCNIEFDIEKYKGIVTDMVNNQVNVVDVTNPNAKQVELEGPNGNIRAVEVEVNGVKVYVDKSVNPPKVVETQDIVQNTPNGKPLVKMDDVLNAVANERAMSQNMMPKYQQQARANVENYSNITKVTGNEGMER